MRAILFSISEKKTLSSRELSYRNCYLFFSFFFLFPSYKTLYKITRKGWKQNFEGKELWIKNIREGEFPPPFTVRGIKRRERGLHAGLNSMYIWSTCKREPTPVTHTNHDQWFTAYGQQVDPKWGFIRAFVTPWY